jgi:hypothetical protein
MFRCFFSVKFIICAAIAFGLLSSPICLNTWAANEESNGTFLRITTDNNNQPVAFQSAILRLERGEKKSKPTIIDLVSVVHIGERSYYESLNQLFREYDAVLYELISPPGVVPEKSQGKKGVVSTIQNAIKKILKLEFQLDHIDYKQANFVHADLSPEEFMSSFGERGDSFTKMLLRILFSTQAQQNSAEEADKQIGILAALIATENSDKRALALRRQVVKDFEKLDAVVSGIEGSKGSGVVAARNERAYDILRDTLRQGKKKIAIFYGAAHMPDFAQRITSKLGFVEKEKRWLVAWRLADVT